MKDEWSNISAAALQKLESAMEQELLTVEEVRMHLDTSEKGKMRQSKRNCVTVLEKDPVLADAVKYNILTGRVDIVKPLSWERDSVTLTDADMNHLYLYMEDHYDLTSEKNIQAALKVVADKHKYHPIRDLLSDLKWDQVPRIREALHHFLGAEISDYTYEALCIFMMGAINRVFHPGCKFEQMLCLVGGQGAGKSTFLRFLAIRDEWFSDDLKKLDDENVYRKLQGHWIMEMSEMLATANAKSIEETKSFLSRQKETYKIPYETHPEDRPRQCVFGGTSNAMDFLPLDRTGNRRFIPILVQESAAEVHILENEEASRTYIRQMWAEAMEIYRSGKYPMRFSKKMNEYLVELQKNFMPEDTKVGRIQSFLDDYKEDWVCTEILYKEALQHPYDEAKQWERREIGNIMQNSIVGWQKVSSHRFKDYGPQRAWKRVGAKEPDEDGFMEVGEQMELPFE